MEEDDPTIDERLRKAAALQRMLIGGLMAGVVVLCIVVTGLHYLVFDGKAMQPDLPKFGGLSVVTILAVAITVGTESADYVLVNTMRRRVVRRTPSGLSPSAARATLLAGWQGENVIHAGLVEGPAVLSLVLFLIGGDAVLLSVAAYLLALLIVSRPSEPFVRRWLEEAEDELEAKRAGG